MTDVGHQATPPGSLCAAPDLRGWNIRRLLNAVSRSDEPADRKRAAWNEIKRREKERIDLKRQRRHLSAALKERRRAADQSGHVAPVRTLTEGCATPTDVQRLVERNEFLEARWQEMEHPFDHSEFAALTARLTKAEAERDAALTRKVCLTCNGRGSIEGFFIGSRKACPACKGSGFRG